MGLTVIIEHNFGSCYLWQADTSIEKPDQHCEVLDELRLKTLLQLDILVLNKVQ